MSNKESLWICEGRGESGRTGNSKVVLEISLRRSFMTACTLGCVSNPLKLESAPRCLPCLGVIVVSILQGGGGGGAGLCPQGMGNLFSVGSSFVARPQGKGLTFHLRWAASRG